MIEPTTARPVDNAGSDEGELSKPRTRTGLANAVFASLAIVGALSVLAILAPALASDDPLRIDFARSALPPSVAHPLGTDRLGRDLFRRWLYAAQLSLGIAATAAVAGSAGGILVGVLSGYRDGWVSGVLGRLADVAFALPIFFVAIALQSVLPAGAFGVILVISATGWMSTARLVRGEALRIRREGYVEAARSLGVSDTRIVLRHILPNAFGTIAAAVTTSFGEALLLQSSLSFLGLGVPPPTPTWGGMLLEAMPEMARGAWWLVVVPGLSILAATGAVGALTERLRYASEE